jgi:hypothetical protein
MSLIVHNAIVKAGMLLSVQRIGYGLEGSGLESQQTQRIVLSYRTFRLALRPIQFPIKRVLWIRRSGYDMDHSSPSTADAANEWN